MDDDSTKTWPQWLQENDAINTFGICRCVLVQHIPKEVTTEKVKLYFENKRRSGGGNIRLIAKLYDGLLILYCDDRCVKNVLKKEHILDDAHLQLFARSIPSLCKDRFLLQNVGNETAMDTVEMLLENCDIPKQRCPNLIKCTKKEQYLAVYEDITDPQEINAIMKQVSGQNLEGHNLQAEMLYPTNALLVENIPLDITKEDIEAFYNNLDGCSDIHVTMVEMCSSDTAIISFAECHHAENVIRLQNDTNLKMAPGSSLKLSLFHHDLFPYQKEKSKESLPDTRGHKQTTSNVVQTSGDNSQGTYTIPHGHDILSFLGFNNLRKALRSQFSHQSDVTICVNETIVYIQYVLVKNCKALTLLRELQKFFTKYASECVIANIKDISKLRVSNKWKEDEEIIEIKVGPKKVNVFARWRDNQVQITGNKDDVAIATNQLKQFLLITSQSLFLSKSNYRLLMRVGCLDQLTVGKELKVKCNESESVVVFTGAEEDMKYAKQELAYKLLLMEPTPVETKLTRFQARTPDRKKHMHIPADPKSVKSTSTQTDSGSVDQKVPIKLESSSPPKTMRQFLRNPESNSNLVGTNTPKATPTKRRGKKRSFNEAEMEVEPNKEDWTMKCKLLPAILGCNKPTHCLEINIPNPNKECAPHTKTAYIPGNPEAKDTINRIHQLVKSKKLFQAEMDVKRGLIYKCILPNLAFSMHDLKELSMKKLLEELAEQEK